MVLWKCHFWKNTDGVMSYQVFWWSLGLCQVSALGQNVSLLFQPGGFTWPERLSLFFLVELFHTFPPPAPCHVPFRSDTRSLLSGYSCAEHVDLLGDRFPGLTCEALWDYCSVSNCQYNIFICTVAHWCQCYVLPSLSLVPLLKLFYKSIIFSCYPKLTELYFPVASSVYIISSKA